jgi:hypothetical protein
MRKLCWDSLIDWISDTRSQGYANLQSLVKCLDHIGIQPQQCESSAGIGKFDCPVDDSKHAGLKKMSLLLMIAQAQYGQEM